MKLQNYSSPLILILLCAGLLGSSCTRNFDSINTNPEDVITVSTESLFARACLGATNGPGADFQQYYDVYRDVNPWMELWVYNGGNPTAFNEVGQTLITAMVFIIRMWGIILPTLCIK